ncbi:MAG TPA: HAMP domain-containing sensor histidine kinase [Anaerolineales bacterium]
MRPFHRRIRDWHNDPDQHPSWGGPPNWVHKRRFLFFRFGRLLVAALLLYSIGMAGLAFLFNRLSGGGQSPWLIWVTGCGLSLAFPVLFAIFGARTFTRIVNPLARVMAAADAVADGDFSVRVPQMGPGEFGRLAQSFNRMASELERTDQLRRSLTADVAHELRTPLHIIRGNLEGLLDGVYEPTPEKLNLLLEETNQLARLVEDLRTLSLAEAGQLPLKPELLDVGELLADAATSFSGQAEAAGIDLQVVGSPESSALTIRGDAGRLDQVLSNLLANALRHTPPGGKITLQAEAVEGVVRIRVADNGSGIPEADLPNIFDRFWSSDHLNGDSQHGGSGLGLAIARQLVQAHQGKISATSQPDQGTVFTIDLPIALP